ncbi:MAG: hypothetical protein MK179_14120 [Pirellulaceae bacterium]|nr:hypothetical protein [Pirellulaceae bacterium]
MKIAVITTVFRYRSHAHVILENFLEPYLFNGGKVVPDQNIVSMYVDQFPKRDMARAVAKEYGIPIYSTIKDALCRGKRKLDVDAVLLIAEHGRYGFNARGQKRYPRKQFFDQVVEVMRSSGRVVPIFLDKHLSYRWDWAQEMMETIAELGIPFMAGSSVPLAQRRPNIEIPRGAKIAESVSVHGGPIEAYGFHAFEVLQSFVESRQGGETGVASIEALDGEALWKGDWSKALAEAAMAAELGKAPASLKRIPGEAVRRSGGAIVRYQDGSKATMLTIGKSDPRYNFAYRLQGERKIRATCLNVGPWINRNLFKALCHAIQHHFRTGQSPYPLERTFLTTGMTDALMRAREQSGPLSTPHLDICYKPKNFKAMREMGKTWDILTEDIPQPKWIDTFCG